MTMIRINKDCEFKRVDEKSLILEPKSGIFYKLNQAGTLIVELIINNNSKDQIVKKLSKEFKDVSEERILKDLNEYEEEMKKFGIVEDG
ncbi:PqqD family peptide modification chaperone [Candidatus Woesearchaeota archaeon]|nr:PqqD family peptide modification chaperone [Candidatus Woesearchaeota archaeon]